MSALAHDATGTFYRHYAVLDIKRCLSRQYSKRFFRLYIERSRATAINGSRCFDFDCHTLCCQVVFSIKHYLQIRVGVIYDNGNVFLYRRIFQIQRFAILTIPCLSRHAFYFAEFAAVLACHFLSTERESVIFHFLRPRRRCCQHGEHEHYERAQPILLVNLSFHNNSFFVGYTLYIYIQPEDLFVFCHFIRSRTRETGSAIPRVSQFRNPSGNRLPLPRFSK